MSTNGVIIKQTYSLFYRFYYQLVLTYIIVIGYTPTSSLGRHSKLPGIDKDNAYIASFDGGACSDLSAFESFLYAYYPLLVFLSKILMFNVRLFVITGWLGCILSTCVFVDIRLCCAYLVMLFYFHNILLMVFLLCNQVHDEC